MGSHLGEPVEPLLSTDSHLSASLDGCCPSSQLLCVCIIDCVAVRSVVYVWLMAAFHSPEGLLDIRYHRRTS